MMPDKVAFALAALMPFATSANAGSMQATKINYSAGDDLPGFESYLRKLHEQRRAAPGQTPLSTPRVRVAARCGSSAYYCNNPTPYCCGTPGNYYCAKDVNGCTK